MRTYKESLKLVVERGINEVYGSYMGGSNNCHQAFPQKPAAITLSVVYGLEYETVRKDLEDALVAAWTKKTMRV